MISPTDFLENDEKRLNKIVQTLQSKSQGYVGTNEFLYDLYAFYKVDGEIVARDNGFKNFAEFLKSKTMHPYVEVGMNMDGKTIYQSRRNPRTDHIQFCYKEQNPYENTRNRASDRNVVASSSKFLYNPPPSAPVAEKPQKQQKINWELPDSFSEEEDVEEPSNGSLRSNNATTASGRMASSDKVDKKEESTKIRYTQRAAGQYTDDEDSDNEADDDTVTASNKFMHKTANVAELSTSRKKTSENSDDNIFAGVTRMKKFTKPTSNESNQDESETALARTLEPPKTFHTGSHGEKWLTQLQQQKKHRVTENTEINHKETNVVSPPLTSSVNANQTKRAASVASMENLEKLGDVIQAMVEYHSPRAILLEDLMDAMEKVEPKFLTLEDETKLSYTAFLRQYCPNVNVFGNAKCLNLLWKENED
ncbi:hypothetical protein DdX_12148 [Ditylenchus destructor]|uniref:DUF7515 domain-containing protein n=1 Tax=Ditylenchus destructor TaxID=166010 RepID=A0AAD4QXK2_9BILA|nr:hypothetical protein DdX_12148 [Ditylenchus destructor]